MPVHPDEAIKFIEHALRLTRGRWATTPFLLEDWQSDIVRQVLRLDARGRRVLREVVIGMARKNGKTELTAAIALCLLILDREPGGEVIGAAAKRDQAKLMLHSAKRMVQYGKLNGRPLTDFLVVQRDHIYFPELDAVYRVISAEAQKEHGANPHAVIIDEGHAALEQSRELYDTLLTAQGTRSDPLGIVITTAGPRPSGPMHDLYRYGKEIESGIRSDPSFGFFWYEAPPNAAVDDPEAWEAANPALGGRRPFLRRSFLAKAAGDVLSGRAPEYMFRRLHLNQWTTAAERWLPSARWDACGRPPDIPDGAPVWLGIDASLRRDTFAVAWVWVEEGGGWTETPEGVQIPANIAHAQVRRFVPHKDGDYIDPNEVRTFVLGLAAQHPIIDVAYDPAYMQMLAADLADRGLPMNPYSQSPENMTRAAEVLFRLVIDGRLRHGNDAILNEQMAAVAVRETDRGVRISKQKSGLPIDAAVAVAMALERALGQETAPGDFAEALD